MRLPQLLLFMLPLFLISCNEDSGPSIDAEKNYSQLELIEAINNEGAIISKSPLLIDDDQLRVLDEVAKSHLVGLGEATHGTKEFFQMKHRIFKYLVENHGFDAFLFEIDMAEARIFNDWVQWRRDDDITTLMSDKMLFTWVWDTKEVRALFEYMRSANEGKNESEMIGFYGVDVQFADYDLLQLVDILKAANIEQADSVRLMNIDHIGIRELANEVLTEIQLNKLAEGLKYAKQVVTGNENQIRIALGDGDLLWAKQLVRHMEQVQEVFLARRTTDLFKIRDKFMAENTNWYFDLLGQDSKFALWAHNTHVSNDHVLLSQGYHLKNDHGDDYQILGFSFAKGDFTARDMNSDLATHTLEGDLSENSINSILYQSTLDNFILNVKTQDLIISDWLDAELFFLSIGAVFNGNQYVYYKVVKLKQHYDYIIHFDVTNNSELLAD